jgi:hypothetical protein
MARTKLKSQGKGPRKLMGCMKAAIGRSSAYYPPHGDAREWSDTGDTSDDEHNGVHDTTAHAA